MTMLAARSSPQEAYRKVELDARVAGADPRELVALCYEEVISALGSAIFAAENGDNLLKSRSLTRALAALTALQLGVRPDQPTGPELLQVYGAARQAVLDNVIATRPQTLALIRQDFIEIARALL